MSVPCFRLRWFQFAKALMCTHVLRVKTRYVLLSLVYVMWIPIHITCKIVIFDAVMLKMLQINCMLKLSYIFFHSSKNIIKLNH
jgi:hypothetical protein